MTTTSEMMQMFIDLHLIQQTSRDYLVKIAETGDITPFLTQKHFLWEILGFLNKHKMSLDDGPTIYSMIKEHLQP
jgi:hypothetical protein